MRRPLSLGYRMLGPQYRGEVIRTMKDPLRLAIGEFNGKANLIRKLRAIWRIYQVCQLYPKVTRANCSKPNTLVLLDLKDWFFEHLGDWGLRTPMFEGMWNMFINVYDHAGEYSSVIDKLVEKLAEVYNSGAWQKSQPRRRFWRNHE